MCKKLFYLFGIIFLMPCYLTAVGQSVNAKKTVSAIYKSIYSDEEIKEMGDCLMKLISLNKEMTIAIKEGFSDEGSFARMEETGDNLNALMKSSFTRFSSYKEAKMCGLYPSLNEEFELKDRGKFADDENGTKEMASVFQIMKTEGTPFIRKVLSAIPSELNDFDSLRPYLIKLFEENNLSGLMYSKDLLFFEKTNLLMASSLLEMR